MSDSFCCGKCAADGVVPSAVEGIRGRSTHSLGDWAAGGWTATCDAATKLVVFSQPALTSRALQVNMWSMKQKPEFQQKFPELSDSPDQPQVCAVQPVQLIACQSVLSLQYLAAGCQLQHGFVDADKDLCILLKLR